MISFSGGRTSGFMLKKIIDAHEGQLPEDVYVVFANTGKEMPQTLDFVKDCEDKWDCKIHWVELYDVDKDAKGDNTDGWIFKYKLVDYDTASRNGEPFEKLIDHYGKLPNSTNRFCTFLLKQRAVIWFERQLGLQDMDQVIGLRADEPRRVHRIKERNGKAEYFTPLHDAKIIQKDIQEFWRKNNFDLNLLATDKHTLFGNCDMCFLKGKSQLLEMMKHREDLANWWIEKEKQTGKTFKYDISYEQMIEIKNSRDRQQSLFFDDESVDCFCHD
jgi:3'-phosphoadenosine 5'-phosphosulfate sulfotransferase (PAPS reductase)/FAD synthetase